ncbi:uncharacterized protein [Venturia canescens]|uniref:uncharacterized protein n=1 Tax=Venturia canescens TaxID=32260 RepID=UPI001C9D253C|nr:uncharacterized protein LOC122413653 [Venturia canescens]
MNETRNHDAGDERIESSREKRRAPSTPGNERTKTGPFVERRGRERNGKISDEILSGENETYRNLQALLLATSVLVLSYHGFRYGRTEYSVLENGNIVNGFVSAKKAVITFSLGYPVLYSFASSLSACMLLYSIIWKKPRWSLPSIIVYLTDLVCHVADALVAFWLFFSHLKFGTALLYTSIVALVITGELWIWLGVLRLFEHRTFN